jgi:hypothetical protein
MSIARKPQSHTNDSEREAEHFIASAGRTATEPPTAGTGRTAPVMIRFDRALLAKVDQAARKRGVSRSAWVQYTISRALEAGEG